MLWKHQVGQATSHKKKGKKPPPESQSSADSKKQSSDKAISVSRLIDTILNLTVGNKKQTGNSDL